MSSDIYTKQLHNYYNDIVCEKGPFITVRFVSCMNILEVSHIIDPVVMCTRLSYPFWVGESGTRD